MNTLSELDIAELRHEMRELYKKTGYDGSLQALYEILKAGEILSEVIVEEMRKNEPRQ